LRIDYYLEITKELIKRWRKQHGYSKPYEVEGRAEGFLRAELPKIIEEDLKLGRYPPEYFFPLIPKDIFNEIERTISQPIPKTNKRWKELRMIQRHWEVNRKFIERWRRGGEYWRRCRYHI